MANRLDDDLSRLRREAEDSAHRRQQLIRDLRKNRDDLEMAVNGEYRSLLLNGQEIRPVDASKEVAQGVGQHDWLPGPVNAGAPLPLSIAEIHALYDGTAAIPQTDEPELAHMLPPLAQLWSPERFEAQVQEFTNLNASLLAFRRDLWNDSNPHGDLEAMLTRMREGLEMLTRSEQEPWRLAAIEAGMAGDAARRLWEMACKDIETVQRQAEVAADLCYRHTPQPPEGGDLDTWLAIVEEIIVFLAQGKTLTSFKLLWNPRWKQFIESSRVEGGARPGRLDHFQAIKAELRQRQSRAGLIQRWKQHLEPLGLPSLAEAPDPLQFAAQHVPGINASLDWHFEHWRPIEGELQAHGLDALAGRGATVHLAAPSCGTFAPYRPATVAQGHRGGTHPAAASAIACRVGRV